MADLEYIQNQNDYIASGYFGSPGSQVTFSRNGNTLTFERDPLLPDRSLSFVQADVMSTGAERIGRDYYAKGDLINLQFPDLGSWDKGRLLAWWKDVARGMANSFTFTDVFGVAATVRFASPRLPEIKEKKTAPGRYEIKLSLRVC